MIANDDADRLREFRDRQDIEFPFLLDPAAETIRAWGLLNESAPDGGQIPHPSAVILDREGRVRFVHIDANYRLRPPTEELVDRLRELEAVGVSDPGALLELHRDLEMVLQPELVAGVHAELQMQRGEFTLQQAIQYLISQVPLMEPDLARYDLQIYLRRPTYGMNYVMGKIQLEGLLSDRAQQLGEHFDLGAFHDQFLAAGPIPISVIRWQMTGLDDEVRALF